MEVWIALGFPSRAGHRKAVTLLPQCGREVSLRLMGNFLPNCKFNGILVGGQTVQAKRRQAREAERRCGSANIALGVLPSEDWADWSLQPEPLAKAIIETWSV